MEISRQRAVRTSTVRVILSACAANGVGEWFHATVPNCEKRATSARCPSGSRKSQWHNRLRWPPPRSPRSGPLPIAALAFQFSRLALETVAARTARRLRGSRPARAARRRFRRVGLLRGRLAGRRCRSRRQSRSRSRWSWSRGASCHLGLYRGRCWPPAPLPLASPAIEFHVRA